MLFIMFQFIFIDFSLTDHTWICVVCKMLVKYRFSKCFKYYCWWSAAIDYYNQDWDAVKTNEVMYQYFSIAIVYTRSSDFCFFFFFFSVVCVVEPKLYFLFKVQVYWLLETKLAGQRAVKHITHIIIFKCIFIDISKSDFYDEKHEKHLHP